jgi:diphthine synthase
VGEIVFVGLGLHDERGISLRGLEEIKTADSVFMERYTSLMPGLSIRHLEEISGKRLRMVSRRELEEENGKTVLESAKHGKTVLLVPGDPLIATTHVTLRIEAEKHGIKTRLVHGASILSAVIGLSGLHSYKFGKNVTVPFEDENPSETPYNVIAENNKAGVHTLCLLDMKEEEKRFLSIHEALETLLKIEAKRKCGAVTMDTVAIGIGRAGSDKPEVKADVIRNLLNHDFGTPPHTIIFPAKLHFMEAEALIFLAGAPEKLRDTST